MTDMPEITTTDEYVAPAVVVVGDVTEETLSLPAGSF